MFCEMDQHESASAKIARGGMDDGQREACSHCGIHGVAAFLKDLDAGIGREVVNADHHCVLGANRLLAGQPSGCGLLLRVIRCGVLCVEREG